MEKLEQFLRRMLLMLLAVLTLEALIVLPPMAWRAWTTDDTIYWLKCVAQDPIDSLIYRSRYRKRCQNGLKQIGLALPRESDPTELSGLVAVAKPLNFKLPEPSVGLSLKAQEMPQPSSGALGQHQLLRRELEVQRPLGLR
jgi:hypothetical protein